MTRLHIGTSQYYLKCCYEKKNITRDCIPTMQLKNRYEYLDGTVRKYVHASEINKQYKDLKSANKHVQLERKQIKNTKHEQQNYVDKQHTKHSSLKSVTFQIMFSVYVRYIFQYRSTLYIRMVGNITPLRH